ncbi:MAG: SDR family oxidoreductase [Chloroflexota bacterium]
MRLQDKTAIITGAGSGIGRASALLFAREGARVVLCDINEDGGRESLDMVRAAGGEAVFVPADVSRAADAARAVEAAVNSFGKIDILFSNAGIVQSKKPFEAITEEEWDHIFAVNVKGAFLMAKHAVPFMKKARAGTIIFTGSIGGVRVRPLTTAYVVSKAAVITLTKALALELAPFGIRVNCINPVATNTPMIAALLPENATAGDLKKWRQELEATIPLGKMPEPEDIAWGALFLASDEASVVTGIELNLDGGRGI